MGRFLLLFAGLLVATSTQPSGAQDFIQWQYDLDQARKVASDQGKLLLLHFSASWCAPCKELERFVFINPTAIRSLSHDVVPVKIDVDLHPDLADEYDIHGIPADVVITPAGHVLLQRQSPRTSDEYVSMVKSAIERSRSMTSAEETQAIAQRAAVKQADRSPRRSSPYDTKGWHASLNLERYEKGGGEFLPPPLPNNQITQTTAWQAPAAPATDGPVTPKTPKTDAVAEPAFPAQQVDLQASPDGRELTSGGGDFRRTVSNSAATSAQSQLISTDSNETTSGLIPSSMTGQSKTADPSASAAEPSGAAEPNGAAQVVADTSGNGVIQPTKGLDSFCPVTLIKQQQWVKGDRQWGCIHRGRLYLFTSKQHRDLFQATPDQFSPLLGGFDPVEYLENGDLVDGLRAHGVFYSDEDGPQLIVLFKDKPNRDKFEENPAKYLQPVRQAMSRLDQGLMLR